MGEKQQLKNINPIDNKQIIECLYNYIYSINVGIEWSLEFLKEKAPSICIKQIGSAVKIKENIIGGYSAELPFAVYVKNKVDDTRNTLDITDPLNKLASIFENETLNGCTNILLPEHFICDGIEMTETPEDVSGKQNNEAIFMALYKLNFRKKSKYS